MMRDTIREAQGKWFGILRALGVSDQYLQNKHGPCPFCGGRDRFRFDDKDGSGSFFCSQCGSGRGINFVMSWKGCEFKEAAKAVDEVIGYVDAVPQKPKNDPLPRLKKIEAGLKSIDGINPVRMYLRNRGLSASQTSGLKYHEAIPYYHEGKQSGTHPAMVAKIVAPDGKPLTYHVTHLTRDGFKALVPSVKKILPGVGELAGGAIRLGPVAETIGIAEGIETALAVNKLFGVSCWASATAILLEKFTPPEGVKAVQIFGDNDAGFTGQRAAYCLANRLAICGIACEVFIPAEVGTDFADLIEKKSEAQA